MSVTNHRGNNNKNNDDRSTGSAKSNVSVSQFLRTIIPTTNQWSDFIPQAASNLFGGASGGGHVNQSDNGNCHAIVDRMLIDAVAFDGDMDNASNSYIQNSSIPPDFMDMDIDVPLARFGSNMSNISPLGNVSSRVPLDEDDDSDDDLDRILGTMQIGLPAEHIQQEQQQLQAQAQPQHLECNSGELNTTLPTLFSAGSLEVEVDAAALGDCVLHPSNGETVNNDNVNDNRHDNNNSKFVYHLPEMKSEQSRPNEHAIEVTRRISESSSIGDVGPQKKTTTLCRQLRAKSRTLWLVAICVMMVLVLAIMIGLILPSSGVFNNNNNSSSSAVASANSAETAQATTTSTFTDLLPTSKPTFLRPTLKPPLALTGLPTKNPSPPPAEIPVIPSWSDTFGENESKEGTRNSEREEERGNSRLPQVRLDMGPLVGHTTHNSATLWAYYLKPAIYLSEENYSLEIMLYDSDGWVRTIDEPELDREKNNAVFATLTDLEPQRVYRFEMRIMNQIVGSGSFKTAPSPTNSEKGVSFEYLLASCMDASENDVQKAWNAIPEIHSDGTTQYPDFAMLAGDTIYLQEEIDVDDVSGVDFDRYWYRNYEQRTEPHFANFVSNTPIYAIWNNNDYGAGVATRDQVGKEESLRAWNSLWPNPASPGNSNIFNQNGIYYSFYWGDVHFIVTDDHWNRNPVLENRWGYEQTEWIRSELLSSTGTFKVIVLGSDILEEGWGSDLENIGAIVTENSINGVLFNAGDIHRNQFKRRSNEALPYPINQITSSGIAKVWRMPFAKIAVDTTVEDPFITVRFFGATTMDDDPTWVNDPELECSTVESGDRGLENSCTQTIRLSELSIA